MSRFVIRLLSFALLLVHTPTVFAESPLAERVLGLLQDRCASCHGPDSTAKGGLGYILDRDRLVQRKQVLPNKPDASPLWKRVHKGEMPPKKNSRLPEAEVTLLRQWVADGAPPWNVAVETDAPMSLREVVHLVKTDLDKMPTRQRRFQRYLSLAHLVRSGLTPTELDRHRHALAKLANSLSWHPRLTKPIPIDEAETVFRLDLRHYRWSRLLWERLSALTPYPQYEDNTEFQLASKWTRSEHPLLRGDWFLATASRPPFYHEFLQLPSSARALERLLQVEASQNIDNDDVLRAGFNDSGVARNNRLIERHDAAHGAYWRSYDFGDNTERRNLFQYPLGPSARGKGFSHDGGEIIFNLPNGLQGYLLVDSLGRRIDKAPNDIVSDPQRPDRQVETGISCMTCHVHGLLPKTDQVRAHASKPGSPFTKDEREAILAVYAPAKTFQARLDEDVRRFRSSLTKLDIPDDEPEPISHVMRRYEATLDARTAAAEAGLSKPEFLALLKASPYSETLGPLLADGTIQRTLWEEEFDELAEYLGKQTSSKAKGPTFRPFSGHTGSVEALAFSPDGSRLATGGDDGTIRIWDKATGRQLLLMKGHREEVRCVAWSPDGKTLASGGQDRTLRIWNASTGEQLRTCVGHTDRIEGVAFLPDGDSLVSIGLDASLRIWNADSGKQTRHIAQRRPLRALAVHPKKATVAIAGDSGSVSVWNIAKGRELARWSHHTKPIYALAFSPNGKRVASAGSDRTVVVWNLKKKQLDLALPGHSNTVVELGFRSNDILLSASSQYRTPDSIVRIWNLKTSELVGKYIDEPDKSVERATFTPTGDAVLLSDPKTGLRIEQLEK